MLAPSSTTMIAAEPRYDPAAGIESKSRRRVELVRRDPRTDEPPRMTAFSCLPPATPPPTS